MRCPGLSRRGSRRMRNDMRASPGRRCSPARRQRFGLLRVCRARCRPPAAGQPDVDRIRREIRRDLIYFDCSPEVPSAAEASATIAESRLGGTEPHPDGPEGPYLPSIWRRRWGSDLLTEDAVIASYMSLGEFYHPGFGVGSGRPRGRALGGALFCDRTLWQGLRLPNAVPVVLRCARSSRTLLRVRIRPPTMSVDSPARSS